MLHTPPCRDCLHQHPHCHVHCMAYRTWRQAADRERAAVNRQKALEWGVNDILAAKFRGK